LGSLMEMLPLRQCGFLCSSDDFEGYYARWYKLLICFAVLYYCFLFRRKRKKDFPQMKIPSLSTYC